MQQVVLQPVLIYLLLITGQAHWLYQTKQAIYAFLHFKCEGQQAPSAQVIFSHSHISSSLILRNLVLR